MRSQNEHSPVDQGRILVVDDEESIRFTFRSFLEDSGYQVTTAICFDDAVEALAEHTFHIAYVDIILGEKTGIDLLEAIKRRSPSTEVIVVTGAPTVDTASTAMRLGALDYLVKPVRQETLIHSATMTFKHLALLNAKETYRLNLEAIFRSVRDAIITVDQDLRLVEVNHAAEKLLGLQRAEVVGHTLEGRGRELGRACSQALRNTVSNGEAVTLRRVDCRDAEPGAGFFDISATPLRDGNGSTSGAVAVIHDETRVHELEQWIVAQQQAERIIGRSAGIEDILSKIRALAEVKTSVLICGESGTGKELIARALHEVGPWSARPLVAVNCAALSEGLLDSELFGHVRGAFTGADRNKVGRFERANGGTIFLDEIGDISPEMQLRFLRVLETKCFERVGDSTPLEVDVRVVAATNSNLRAKVAEGSFREDLFYRLKVFEIRIPPLRERREDIPLLVRHFIERGNRTFGKQVLAVSDTVMELFARYRWPGNVRELENALEHAFVLCRGDTIDLDDLPADLVAQSAEATVAVGAARGPAMAPGGTILPLEEVEQRYLAWAAQLHHGDNVSLARKLGLSERTLYRKLHKIREGTRDDELPETTWTAP